MIYTAYLYNQIIKTSAKHFEYLRVITGYCSGNFLKRIYTDFPNLSIDVYIGMAQNGISYSDFQIYKELTRKSQIKVFFHVSGPNNHQKIIEFKNPGRIAFIGSANFSENGFGLSQNEIVAEVKDNLDNVFSAEKKNCISVLNPLVSELIPLIQDSDYLANKLNSSLENSQIISKPSQVGESKSLIENTTPAYTSNGPDIFLPLLPEGNKETWQWVGINNTPSMLPIQNPYNTPIPEGSVTIRIGKKKYSAHRTPKGLVLDGKKNILQVFEEFLQIPYEKPLPPAKMAGYTHAILSMEGKTEFNMTFLKGGDKDS